MILLNPPQLIAQVGSVPARQHPHLRLHHIHIYPQYRNNIQKEQHSISLIIHPDKLAAGTQSEYTDYD